MLELTCPSCGKRIQGDDSFAGKYVVCSSCNTTCTAPQLATVATAIAEASQAVATAPVSEGAFSEGLPPVESAPNVRKPAPWSMMPVIWVLVAIGIVVTLVGLLVPSVEKVREAAAQTQSTNNLKQIGMSMHGFHDSHKRLPFNGTIAAAANDPTSGSWAFQILPFADDRWALFNQPNVNVGVSTLVPWPLYDCLHCGRGAIMQSIRGSMTRMARLTLRMLKDAAGRNGWNVEHNSRTRRRSDRYGENIAFEQSLISFAAASGTGPAFDAESSRPSRRQNTPLGRAFSERHVVRLLRRRRANIKLSDNGWKYSKWRCRAGGSSTIRPRAAVATRFQSRLGQVLDPYRW